MSREFWREHWAKRQAANVASSAAGKVVMSFVGHRIHVVAPLHPDFVKGANELLGRWRSTSKMWTFNRKTQRLVMALCVRVYGKEAITLVGFPDNE